MGTKTVNKLAVPGATLHYEVTGSGPVLLLIAGGGTDAGIFDGIVGRLAADYTVVAYDPRGCSRSPYDGAPSDERVDQSAEDALAVIDAVGGSEPAYVFGSSSGAITGLELISRHPDRVRLLVAHEPPAVEVLPDAADHRAFFEQVYDTYQTDGVDAAEVLFSRGLGADQDEPPAPEDMLPEILEMFVRFQGNAANFYQHKLLPFTRYQPDLEALKAAAASVVPAAGADSMEYLPGRPIQQIAEDLGWPVVTFPGGHAGYLTHPEPFATLLARVLESE
ncbi:alpha/beta fold hydrolase [Kribbella sp. NPDC056951]|uniref:alpha/beta fold hydrolase n=1 Tax=Kribbella sp. NPDC056951 TaxID=3345978 RepID=UPI003640D14A